MAKYVQERGNKFYRLVDRYLGIPLVWMAGRFKNNHRPIPPDINRIGILRTSCIGDTVLLEAISRDLRKIWPTAEQVLFAGRDNFQVAEMLETVDEVKVLPMNRPWAAAKKVYEAGRFDVWLDFSQWARIDALLSRVARAGCKIGFKTPKQYRHYGYDKWVEHRNDVHEMENYRNLVRAAGVRSQSLPAFRADSELFETSDVVRPGISYIVLHMFPGGSRAKMKEWPEEHWLEVARFCLRKGLAVVLTGGPGDYARAQNFRDKLGIDEEVFNLAGRLPLKKLPSLLAYAKSVVSIDTGVMHLAAAVGTKLIALHGPTSPRRWGPLSPEAKVIEPQNMSCHPCLQLGFEYKCNKNYCLQNIAAEVVIDAIKLTLILTP